MHDHPAKTAGTTSKRVLILGNGPTAAQTARLLLDHGRSVILAFAEDAGDALEMLSKEPPGADDLQLLPRSMLQKASGCIGDFHLVFSQTGRQVPLDAAAVIVAEECQRHAGFELYGLQPAERVIGVSDFAARVEATSPAATAVAQQGDQIVFLCGLARQSDADQMRTVMTLALKLQTRYQAQASILTSQLQVAGDGLERLYRETRRAGVIYFKFDSIPAQLTTQTDESLYMQWQDPLSGCDFSLRPAKVVIDEGNRPGSSLARIAAVLGLEADSNGFVQADNVHRCPVATNRRGILALGPSRSAHYQADGLREAQNALAMLRDLERRETQADAQPTAVIDSGKCVRCLTCLRLCPYGAVTLNTRVAVAEAACEGCGMCAAECPQQAIDIPQLGAAIVDDAIGAEVSKPVRENPLIVALTCARSALPAGELAVRRHEPLPQRLIMVAVPCAGAVSIEHVLAAFRQGADGVMLLSCHLDNCHAGSGNQRARERVVRINDILVQVGIDPQRMYCGTLAANMGHAFAKQAAAFEKDLRSLT